MQAGQLVAVWMHDAAAKLFVGLVGGQGKRPVSRWVVVGTVMDASLIGPWVDVQYLEERRSEGEWKETERVRWAVHPGQCLIRWDSMITAQRLKDKETPEDPRPTPGQYL